MVVLTPGSVLSVITIIFREGLMWLEDIDTVQTWVGGGEVILKREGEDFSFRLANEPGDWIPGLPDGLVWADAQALFN